MASFTTDISVSITDLYTITSNTDDIAALQNEVPKAVSVIETITGVFFEAAYREVTITTADAAWLKKAAIYQLVFMREQTDILTRQAVSSISQDGLSLSAPDGLTFVLAPLAKRAIGNCSWAKSGTFKVTPMPKTASVDPLSSDDHPWFPLGGN